MTARALPLPEAEAQAWLARARSRGAGLHLRADFSELERIRPWLESSAGPGGLRQNVAELLESMLYEVCGNVVEHGYACDGSGPLTLWWLPEEPGSDGATRGSFVLLERGRVFDTTTATPADPSRLESRLRGRGLGLAMLARLAPGLRYRPGTSAGNVTILEFDSRSYLALLRGTRHERSA